MDWTRETELRSASVHQIRQIAAQAQPAQITLTIEVRVEYRPYVILPGSRQEPPRNQIIVSLWRARRPEFPMKSEDDGVLLAEFMPRWADHFEAAPPRVWPVPDTWTTTWPARAEVKVNPGSIWPGRYRLFCVVQRARHDALPNRPIAERRLTTTQSPDAILLVQSSAKAPNARNNLPIGITNLLSVIPDPGMNVVDTPYGMIPFTLRHTGYPVLDLQMLARAEGVTPARPGEIAAWVLPKLDAVERSVRELFPDQQLFSTVYRMDGDARSAGMLDAQSRDSSSKLMKLCRAAAGEAMKAPKDASYTRRLRGPLETAVEAIAVDPNNAMAYLWAAYLHALLGEHALAFDFFLTLVFRLRLAERTLAGPVPNPNVVFSPAALPARRTRAALSGRLGSEFWSMLTRTAELLEIKGRIGLNFPNLVKSGT